MRRWSLGILVLFLHFLCGAPLHALDPDLAITQYARTVWRAPQTIPHDDVSALLQTADGYIWVGTVEGLARFDGVRAVVFNKDNTPAFSNNWVKALAEDRQGRLWVATFGGGLLCREHGQFARWGLDRGIPADFILSLLTDRAGNVWVGTGGHGVLRLKGDRFVQEPADPQVTSAWIRSLFEDHGGTLWIGAEDGLSSYKDGVFTRFTRASGLSDERIMALCETKEGLWIGTERGGLNRYADGRFTAVATREGVLKPRIWSLSSDRDGNVWIGMDGGGLDRLTRGHGSSLSTRNGLANDYVWAIREDREGSLWVGTNGGGLTQLKDVRVVPLTTREGLPSDFVWCVRRTGDGSLFVGTEDAGLARLREGRITRFTDKDGLSTNMVKTIVEGRDGSLWIGGDGGLDRLSGDRVAPSRVSNLPKERINALAVDPQGTLWIGLDRHGVYTTPESPGGPAKKIEAVPDLPIQTIRAARDGSVWIGTMQGVYHSVAGEVKNISTRDGLPSAYVSGIAEDSTGAMWIATRGGLARYRNGHVQSLTSRQGLYDDTAVSILPDDVGGLWVGGNRGLYRISLEEAEDVFEGRRSSLRSLVLKLDDGLPSVEVNGASASAWKDRDGRLWFATRGGLASIDPARIAPHHDPVPVRIEDVLADNRPLDGAGDWKLSQSTKRLTFRFTALSFRFPGRVHFWRRLTGFDTEWVEAGTERTADYTNLPRGQYRFEVAAAGEDGLQQEPGASVAFEVLPVLHERLWFRIAVGLLALGVAALIYFEPRRRRAALERVVAARTAELAAANARLAQLSREDGLTGVANRRRLDEAVEEEWRRALRLHTPIGFMLLDVDFFKAYNDLLGHIAGDETLKAVASAVAEIHRRAGEVVARYGGEEFAVLMPAVAEDSLLAAAEVLRKRVQELALAHPGSSVANVITITVGTAWVQPRAGIGSAQLVAAADRALYRAKKAGRNQVTSEPV